MKALIVILFFCTLCQSCNGETGIRIPDNIFSIIQYPDSNEVFESDLLTYLQTTNKLNFPNLTTSVYRRVANTYIWFNKNDQQQLWKDAIKLLDCVTQFGLTSGSYHAKEINYEAVFDLLLNHAEKPVPTLKSRKDILLTDAMITLMVHLHFGKLNPYISLQRIDDDGFTGFRVDDILINALRSPDSFQQSIRDVQPKAPGYTALQNNLANFIKDGKDKCNDLFNDTARHIAINLERYKWETLNDSIYVEINIPSFMLKFRDAGNVREYKVIVGRPINTTPLLISKIDYLTTAPDWTVPNKIFRNEVLPKVLLNPAYLDANNMAIYNRSGKIIPPTIDNLATIRSNPSDYFARQSPGCDNALGQIVFHFSNRFSVYLHDTPDHSLFRNNYRALSHGCIRIENPKNFAHQLLKVDSAPPNVFSLIENNMQSYTRYRYKLKNPVTIVIRYITCDVENGRLVLYADLYKKDKALRVAMFKTESVLSVIPD